jgi:hypothetical protein
MQHSIARGEPIRNHTASTNLYKSWSQRDARKAVAPTKRGNASDNEQVKALDGVFVGAEL